MPPRKRKSTSQQEDPETPPVSLPELPEAYASIAQPAHEALNVLLQNHSQDDSLQTLKETVQSSLSECFPKDREAADSVLYSWVLDVSMRNTDDFALLCKALDVALCCSQLTLCNDTFVVWSLETLFESHSVSKCSQLFTWVERRSAEITAGLDPRKAKALILLRTFNELLRRLSKANQTVFCGRILMFLAASFPLGDQSSVNLKGAFDTGNITTLHEPDWGQASVESGDHEDREKTPVEPKEPDFYTVFWSLQRIFAFPPNLLKPDPMFPYDPTKAQTSSSAMSMSTASTAKPDGSMDSIKLPNLAFLRYAVERTLAKFQEANKKDKKMTGASTGTGATSSKAKAKETAMEVDEAAEQEHIKQHYFFPKFLTSRGLLELQVADSNFRRQILIQVLVVFQFLRGYSKPEKDKAAKIATPNRGLVPQVAIADSEMSWIAQLNQQSHMVIRDTLPDGVAFDATLILVLQREQHWIRWKLSSCQDFVKSPLDVDAASNEAREKKRRLQAPARKLQWKMGNPGLTALWGITGDDPLSLEDLTAPVKPVKDLEYFNRELQKELDLQEERKQALTGDKEPTQRQLADDAEWAAIEDRKASLCWRALRLLAPDELANFSKITKSGNFSRLVHDIQHPDVEIEASSKKGPDQTMAVDTPTAESAEVKPEPSSTELPERPTEEAPVEAQGESSKTEEAEIPPPITSTEVEMTET